MNRNRPGAPRKRNPDFETAPTSNLAGLLGSRPASVKSAPPAEPTAAEPPTPEPEVAPARPAQRAKKKTATTTTPQANREATVKAPRAGAPTQRNRTSSVHLPVRLIERARAYQATIGWTNGQMMIAALEDCNARGTLPSLVVTTPVGGSLFGTTWSSNAAATGSEPGPRGAYPIGLPGDHFDVLDGLVRDLGATSRSQLAHAAIRDYLDHHAPDTTGT